MRKDNSIYNKKQPGLYIYLYLQSQIPTSCYSGKKEFVKMAEDSDLDDKDI